MKLLKQFVFLSSFAVLVLAFQNCGPAFKVVTEEAALQDLATSHEYPHVLKVAEGEVTFNQDIAYSVYMATNTMTYSWSYKLNGLSSGCTEKNGKTSAEYVVNCSKVGYLSVKATISDGNKVTMLPEYLYDLSNSVGAGETVNFSIRSGTASSMWNNANETVEGFIGQKLMIKNDDTSMHQLHTNGSPCEHGNAFATGQTATCTLNKVYSRAGQGRIYDHNLNGDFYLTVYDGSKLYSQNCASCHGIPGGKDIHGFTPNEFFESVRFNDKMKGLDTKLKGKEIEAIAFYLRKK